MKLKSAWVMESYGKKAKRSKVENQLDCKTVVIFCERERRSTSRRPKTTVLQSENQQTSQKTGFYSIKKINTSTHSMRHNLGRDCLDNTLRANASPKSWKTWKGEGI